MLHELGYDIGKRTGIDGDYGMMTESAVMVFQHDHGLVVDGICGPMTWDALQKAYAAPKQEKVDSVKTYTVKIMGLDLTQAERLAEKYPHSSVIEEGVIGQ